MREDLTGDDDSSFSWCLLPVATSCWAGLNKSKSLVSAAALCFAAGANTYNKFHPSHYIRCSGWPSLALTVPSRPPSTVWTNWPGNCESGPTLLTCHTQTTLGVREGERVVWGKSSPGRSSPVPTDNDKLGGKLTNNSPPSTRPGFL